MQRAYEGFMTTEVYVAILWHHTSACGLESHTLKCECTHKICVTRTNYNFHDLLDSNRWKICILFGIIKFAKMWKYVNFG